MSNVGPVHTLIVYEVGDDVDWFEDAEIEHPDECKTEYDPVYQCDRYVCAVEGILENIGLRYSLTYSGTSVTKRGFYPITAWAETYRGFDYIEYDAGIAVIEDHGSND